MKSGMGGHLEVALGVEVEVGDRDTLHSSNLATAEEKLDKRHLEGVGRSRGYCLEGSHILHFVLNLE